MTSEQASDQGQVSETTDLHEDQVQGGVPSEGEPSTAAVRDQDRGPGEDPSHIPDSDREARADGPKDELSAADRAAQQEEE